ncbi:ADP-ribosylglycohydrolase family protein [Mycetocola tolaasinivorans]|uniref:ADP-ribosylglycohydrolase family protein n=1 Tax=Mycetocola tolaasinivorans TaxID=76635 RepID=A0A3L7A753_9MICO|nr:ADP-ribosylglycohydrolase family protein [Mycetocola tolaasinivorans]RLP75718.1 ADP-ribosylglycohydrolase family protein [Mycetocola tolaasinivorans]
MTSTTPGERALASLTGLALGDALGMPTQSMSREQIRADYGQITGLISAGPNQEIAHGMPAGSITDDTEQALLLAEHLIAGRGEVNVTEFAHALLAWEADMAARGSLDLLGPSTKAALERLTAGVPASESGKFGTTNGAAMRVAPIGIAHPVDNISDFVDAVAHTAEVTHNTTLGIASASAVGAMVSAGVAGASLGEALDIAVAAAAEGETRGNWIAGGSISHRLRWALDWLPTVTAAEREDALYHVIGTSVASQESVVAAIALASLSEDPWDTLCLAAGLGGDTDTVAAIHGAILGAVHGPDIWPADAVELVTRVNSLNLPLTSEALLALRSL